MNTPASPEQIRELMLPEPDLRLTLVSLSLIHVELDAHQAGKDTRRISVHVGSGHTARAAVRFPHDWHENGRTLGSDQLDQQVRERAAEELVRLHAAARHHAA